MTGFLQEFIKQAQAAGLSQEQVEKFISDNFLQGKTASEALDDLYTDILKSASIEKNQESIAYVEGFLKSACDSGLNDEEAVALTKSALAEDTDLNKVAANPLTWLKSIPKLFKGTPKPPVIDPSELDAFADIPPKIVPTGAYNKMKGWVSHNAKPLSVGTGATVGLSGVGYGAMQAKQTKDIKQLLNEALAPKKDVTAPAPKVEPPNVQENPAVYEQILKLIKTNPTLTGAGLGGIAGGLAGYSVSPDEEVDPVTGERKSVDNKLWNTMGGAGLGTMLGGLGGYAMNGLQNAKAKA